MMHPEGSFCADLNLVLLRWAELNRLSPDRAEAIRRSIVEDSSPLDAAWWEEFAAWFSGTIAKSVSSCRMPFIASAGKVDFMSWTTAAAGNGTAAAQ